jgi:hypothetical protein
MTVHVSGRLISALLLLSVRLLGTPPGCTRAIRRRCTEDRSHACGAARPAAEFKLNVRNTYPKRRMIFQGERVQVGVKLARHTFTLRPPTESGRAK